MPRQHRLVGAIAALAMAAAACSGSPGSPSASIVASGAPLPAAARPTTAPAASASLQDVAAAYLALVTATNAEFMTVGAQLDAAGSDVEKLKVAWAAIADAEDDFVAGLNTIAWPPEMRDPVDKLAAISATMASLQRELAVDPTDADVQAKLDAAGTAHTPLARDVRTRLGLDQLPTDSPAAPTPTPAA
jgi:hypothetical protein